MGHNMGELCCPSVWFMCDTTEGIPTTFSAGVADQMLFESAQYEAHI
jgi:hypothetical protein